MSVDLQSPQLLAFIAAIRERPGDDSVCQIACDWLQEQGATLADVVRLYAQPPLTVEYYEDRSMDLAYWYLSPFMPITGPGYSHHPGPTFLTPDSARAGIAEDDSLRPLLIAWCLRAGDAERAERVKGWKMYGPFYGEWRVANGSQPWYLEPACPSESAARRALKRAVLREFDGDVRVPGNLPEALFFATARTLEDRRRMAWRSLEINGVAADGIFERDDGRMMTLLRYAPVKPSALIPPEINSGIAVGEFPDQTFMRSMLAADGAPVIHDPRYLIRGSE